MIDSSLFIADVPAGTYAVGQIIALNIKAGPSVVRDGYGTAKLKNIITGCSGDVGAQFETVVMNSNWIDPVINGPNFLSQSGSLTRFSPGWQYGNDCELQVNSNWSVYLKCVSGGTITKAQTHFTLIDIDYPSVASVVDPSNSDGMPVTLETVESVTVNAYGAGSTANWNVFNIDNLKPGYKYLKCKVGLTLEDSGNVWSTGFISFANGASMNGLSRIIPVTTGLSGMTMDLTYSVPEVKGPIDYRFMLFNESADTDNVHLRIDYVKKAI